MFDKKEKKEYWYEAFVTHLTKYCLIDGDGGIRATAYDIKGIAEAASYYGWGEIHECSLKNDKLIIGRKVE